MGHAPPIASMAGVSEGAFLTDDPHDTDTLPQSADGHLAVLEGRVGSTMGGRYALGALLGHGGMSAVYEAVQAPLGRVVALKLLKRAGGPERAALFEREAAIVSRLRHPNNVTLYDYGIADDGEAFLVMERLSGHSLARELAQAVGRRLPARRAIAIAIDICAALAEAHSLGVVHRDLKPGNLMLDRVGELERVKVIDYGVAIEARPSEPGGEVEEGRSEVMFGTPTYSSPEQVMGQVLDGRSDLYSLGVVLFEMLTGRVPFVGEPVLVLIDHVRAPAPRVDAVMGEAGEGAGEGSAVPPALVELVARLLAKTPDARPANAEATRLELASIAASMDSPAGPAARAGEVLIADARRRIEGLRAAGASTEEVAGALDALIRARRVVRVGPHLEAGVCMGGRYTLERMLGRGGFATVWAAHDELCDSRVALKVLHGQWSDDRTRRERFFRGARLMGRLSHPAVVRVLAAEGEADGWFFYVLEYVEGSDLGQAVVEGRVAGTAGVAALAPVAAALAEAHGLGVVHRDVKPSNILIDREGRARITDFDLVRAADTTGGTRTGALGTFLYAAPELLSSAKDAGPAADEYGYAMTLMYVLHGGELPAWVVRRPEAVIRALSCGQALKRVLSRGIAFNAGERFGDLDRFAQAVDAAIRADEMRAAPRASAVMAVAGEHAPVAAATGVRPALMRVPPGDFVMGSGAEVPGVTPFEQPAHPVRISRAYLMAATPVTRAAYAAVAGDAGQGSAGAGQVPACAVSWYDAIGYCNALSLIEGRTPVYRIDGRVVEWVGGDGYRLPTEAEWEWACRGGTSTRYWSGDEEADLERVAWYAANSFGEPRPVAQKPANAYGLHDMHGNVFEWCFDRLGRYPLGMCIDPRGPEVGEERVIRGGSAWNDAGFARVTYRIWRAPTARFPSLGFRVVREDAAPG